MRPINTTALQFSRNRNNDKGLIFNRFHYNFFFHGYTFVDEVNSDLRKEVGVKKHLVSKLCDLLQQGVGIYLLRLKVF